jgi:hypothetical protein
MEERNLRDQLNARKVRPPKWNRPTHPAPELEHHQTLGLDQPTLEHAQTATHSKHSKAQRMMKTNAPALNQVDHIAKYQLSQIRTTMDVIWIDEQN